MHKSCHISDMYLFVNKLFVGKNLELIYWYG